MRTFCPRQVTTALTLSVCLVCPGYADLFDGFADGDCTSNPPYVVEMMT